MSTLLVTPWADAAPPTESTLMSLCAKEGLSPYQWSNGPHDVYSAHKHSYDGDRLELPANTVHDAVVGPQGVVCLEAHL